MKLKFSLLPAVASAIIILVAGCSKKSNTQGRYIPSNAAIVVHVNAASVSAKLPWEEVKQNELFTTMYADSSFGNVIKSALDNPENTGIDIKKDVVFFMIKDSTGGYLAFEGFIKDAGKFKTYNTAALKNSIASEKNGVQFLVSNRTAVSWDKTKFIVVSDAPEIIRLNDMEKILNKDSMPVQPVKSVRDVAATALSLYTLSEGNSLAKNERFSELVNTKGDVHFWANAQALYEGNAGISQLSMVNLKKLYEGSFTLGTVLFDNGKIDVDVKSYAGKEMTGLWKNYSGSKINNDMVERVPSKEVAVLLALNFKPKGLKEFVKLMGLEGLINLGAAFLGFTVDDFVKANNGDILLTVSDIGKDSAGKTNANVLFSASIGDKPSFDKLVNAGKQMGKEGMGAAASSLYFNSNDTYFAIGNKKESVDQYTGKAGSSKFNFYDKISSSPIGGYVNLQYIFNAIRPQAGKDSLGLIALDASAKMWDNIIMSGGQFTKGGITQHIEINLADKTTGSLKQLNKYTGVMANVLQQRKKETNNISEIRLYGDSTGVKDSLMFE